MKKMNSGFKESIQISNDLTTPKHEFTLGIHECWGKSGLTFNIYEKRKWISGLAISKKQIIKLNKFLIDWLIKE